VEAADRTGLGDEPRRGSGTILVVEDDEDVREVSVAMLEGLGYRVGVACNGQEVLSALRRSDRIDLLFTDPVMPRGMSGVALARQAQQIGPGLKVLLTSGYAGVEAREAEGFPIISKPFRPAELGRIIAALTDDNKSNRFRVFHTVFQKERVAKKG
jgi:CheY-like chemotaxis protein